MEYVIIYLLSYVFCLGFLNGINKSTFRYLPKDNWIFFFAPWSLPALLWYWLLAHTHGKTKFVWVNPFKYYENDFNG